MSSYAGVCEWCGKHVMHKTFFGTLHLCLTYEEKMQVMKLRQQQQPNKKWQEFVRKHPQLARPANQVSNKENV